MMTPIESSDDRTILPPFPPAFHKYFSMTHKSQQKSIRTINDHSPARSTSFDTWNRLEETGKSRAACGRYIEALDFYDQALQEKVRIFGENHRILIPTLLYTSKVLGSVNKNHEACLSMERAIRIQQHIGGSVDNNIDHINKLASKDGIFLAKLHVQLGEMQQKHGNIIAAMTSFRDALNIQVDCRQGRTHEEVGYLLFLIARLHHQKRQYSDARECYCESLQIYKGLGTKKYLSIVRAIERGLNDRTMSFWSEQGTV